MKKDEHIENDEHIKILTLKLDSDDKENMNSVSEDWLDP